MTSYSAKSEHPLNVVFVVYPNIVLLDLVGPLQVFTHARKDPQSGPAYQTHVVSFEGGRIKTNTVLPIDSDPIGDWVAGGRDLHTLMVVGGDGAVDASLHQPFVALFRQLADRATRICSVCSGAFVLAAAGLLDGHRAVTHWEDCEKLASDYPAVDVEVDPIYIRDGDVWTSAGITAGIDMALAVIEEDLGNPAAIEMARSLVTPMVRSGGQSQFSAELDRHAHDVEGRFEGLHIWIKDNIAQKISVEDLANTCGMSARNFSRRYTETMGVSPAKAIEAMRVDVARDLLAKTDQSIKMVAGTCGFQDDERMRRAFMRLINTSPSEYRKQFQLHGAASPR
jgi:transcriptional regulator GlxA family with amidase domain